MLGASGHTTGLSVQTDPDCLPPPHTAIPTSSLCCSDKLGSVRAQSELGSNTHPPFLPKTPSAHIHLTLPFSVLPICPPIPMKKIKPFPDRLAEAR